MRPMHGSLVQGSHGVYMLGKFDPTYHWLANFYRQHYSA